MQATELFPLESLRERLSKSVRIQLNGDCTREKLEALWDVLAANQGDRTVAIELEVQNGRPHAPQSALTSCRRFAYKPSRAAARRVERLCGSGSVTVR